MKIVKKAVTGVLVLALVIFAVFFVLNAYNTGKIGDKAGKIAEDFSTELEGTWTGKYSISKLTFKPEGKISLTVLGLNADGEFSDYYDLDTQTHTLNILYRSTAGISVEREFTAVLNGEILTLTDTKIDSVKMTFTRESTENVKTDQTSESKSTQSKSEPSSSTATTSGTTEAYKPGLKKFREDIKGAWSSPTNTGSGYTFDGDGKVKVTLFGVSYDGDYTTSVDSSSGRCELTITYVSVGGVSINNTYYVNMRDGKMILTQKGLESFTTTYTKMQ